MADDLESLAARVEREQPDRDLWREAFCAVRPMPEGMLGFADWNADIGRFSALIAMSALREAAAMLMPDDWYITDMHGQADYFSVLFSDCTQPPAKRRPSAHGEARGPHVEARARLAAALRAHAASKEPGR